MADTLYILSTNGKVYKFSDILSPVSGSIHIDGVTNDSRFCPIDSYNAYITNLDFDYKEHVWRVSSESGSLFDITPFKATSFSVRHLDLYGIFENTLELYKKEYVRIYEW